MKYIDGESFESWTNRFVEKEKQIALKRITKGEDQNLVLEEFSKRITNKMLYPIFKVIRDENKKSTFDEFNNRKKYEEIMDRRGKVADHVDDVLFSGIENVDVSKSGIHR